MMWGVAAGGRRGRGACGGGSGRGAQHTQKTRTCRIRTAPLSPLPPLPPANAACETSKRLTYGVVPHSWWTLWSSMARGTRV